ncbi:MAG: type VI secretion system baseplate subunit TssG [Tropicimonas sp.]|uniref:type VI secretion system baseplate subunit TssG n=1 Tax=Tropicimonas sp. TaxID=2067044 RepID=UPI003A86BF82
MNPRALFDRLRQAPGAFEPTTALRIAEAEAKRRNKPLVIRAAPSSALEPKVVSRVTASDAGVEVESHLMGLTGPLSPLPPAYTEIAARDRRRRAGGLSAFFDLFSDRLTWLFVAAAEKYSLAARLRWQPHETNTILVALRALIGLATPEIGRHAPIPGDGTLRYAGLLAQRIRNAEGLRAMIAAELALPVRVEQFRLCWREVPEAEQTRMQGTARLGVDTMAGSRAPDRAGQCRIVIGPVRYGDFLSLEQGQPRMERVLDLVRLYVGPVIGFDIQIVLDRRDIPQTRLDNAGPPARLGWNSWARSEPAIADSGDAVIRCGA